MFRTEIPIAPAPDQLARTARVLTIGSCFADSIGSRLAANKVETLVNPFGTVFQPLALARLLRAAAGEEVDWQQHLVEARGRWQSYDLHGSIGADSPVVLLQHIQELVRRTGEFLRNADVVLLTLGTAWAYRLRETGELVNNCHKQPADLFVRELLTPDEIINGLAETHAYLRRINPNLRFVLTVSPVRHLKDTLPLNAVSKSVLRVATHILSDLLPDVAYFPAYELLLDDLRDYRFYASDMLHPSEVAEDYIWDKFARTYFDVDFGRFRKEWASVRQSLGHRPLHAGAPEHRQFLENTLEKLEQLSLRKVAVADELSEVRTRLAALPPPPPPAVEVVVEDDEERIDIGEIAEAVDGQAPLQAPGAMAPAGNRTPRLTPEEFRSQRAAHTSGRPERGRRDGRGKGQLQVPTENEQFQASTTFREEEVELQPALATATLLPTELGKAEQALEQAAAALLGTDVTDGSEEPLKKKKRRSRGGAKRTARKHALRLAAGETMPEIEPGLLPEVADAAANQDTAGEIPTAGPAGKKSSVITKSVPVKRRGQRNELSRIPRAQLFASAAETPTDASITAESTASVDAEAPSGVATAAPLVVPAVISEAISQAPATPNPKSRNSRNRGKKPAVQPINLDAGGASTEVAETGPSVVIGSAQQLSGSFEPAVPASASRDNSNNRGRQRKAAPAQPEEPVAPATNPMPDANTTSAPAPARRSNRAKRVVSGARAEKPAVDTPVVPVPDAQQPRTQVAAGRMTGSSASLIEPAAAKKKPTAKKPAAKKPASPKTAKPSIEPAPAAPAASVPATPPLAVKPKPATKPKPAAKPKAAAKAAAPKPKAPRKTPKPE